MTTNNTKDSDSKTSNFNVDSNILSDYVISKRIGKGAYGIVYKAYDRNRKQHVAIKKIYDAFRNKTDAQRTYREILFLKSFQIHPNIITMLNIQKAKNNKDLYVIFEYMENDLNKVIREKILKDIHLRYIMFQLCNGLDYIHKCNVMHRDLKPCNVLIDKSCVIKIGDLGLARSVSDGECLTEYIATRWYRAPEILMSNKNYTQYVDIWSLGCILAEMLLSKPLFPGSCTSEQLQLIVDMIRNVPPHSNKFFDLFKNKSEEGVNLLSEILVLNPNDRPNASKILDHSFIKKYFPSKTHLIPNIIPHPVILDINDNDQLEITDYQNKLYGLIKNCEKIKSDKVIVKNKISSNDKNIIRIKDKTYSKYVSNEKENESKNVIPTNNKNELKCKEKQSVQDDRNNKHNIKMIIATNNINLNGRKDRSHLNEISSKKEKNYISYNKLNINAAFDKTKMKKIRANVEFDRKKYIEVGKETSKGYGKVKADGFDRLEGNENVNTKAILVTSKIYNLDSIQYANKKNVGDIQHVNKKDVEKNKNNIKENKTRVKIRASNMELDNASDMGDNEKRYNDSKHQTVKRNQLKKHEKKYDFIVETKNKYKTVDTLSNFTNENSIIDKIKLNQKHIESIERKIENFIYKTKEKEHTIGCIINENQRKGTNTDSVSHENEQECLKIHRNSYPGINLKCNKNIEIPNISHIDLIQTNIKYANDVLEKESNFRQNRTDSEKNLYGRKFQSEHEYFKQCLEDIDQYKSEPNIHYKPVEPINTRNNICKPSETDSEINTCEIPIIEHYASLNRVKDTSSRNKSISNETILDYDKDDKKYNAYTTKNGDLIRQHVHYSYTNIDQCNDVSNKNHRWNYNQNEDIWYTLRNRTNVFDNNISEPLVSKKNDLNKLHYDGEAHNTNSNNVKQQNSEGDILNRKHYVIDNQMTNSRSNKLLNDSFTDDHRNSMKKYFSEKKDLNKIYSNKKNHRRSSNIDYLLNDDIMQKYKKGIDRILDGDDFVNELSYCNGNHRENTTHKESRENCDLHENASQHMNTYENTSLHNTKTSNAREMPVNSHSVLCNGIKHTDHFMNDNNKYTVCDTIRELRNNNFNCNTSRNNLRKNCIFSKFNKNDCTKGIKKESTSNRHNNHQSSDEILEHNQSPSNCKPNIFNSCFKKNKSKMRKYLNCNDDFADKLDSMYKLSELNFYVQPISIVDSDDFLDNVTNDLI